jgi:hypothetical protein
VAGDSGAYTVSRRGEVSLIPFAGAWFIDSWNLQVDAAPNLLTDSPTPTTVAAAPSATVAPPTAAAPAPAAAAAPGGGS